MHKPLVPLVFQTLGYDDTKKQQWTYTKFFQIHVLSSVDNSIMIINALTVHGETINATKK